MLKSSAPVCVNRCNSRIYRERHSDIHLHSPPLHPRFLERYAVTTAYPEFEEFVVEEVGVGVAGDELLGEQRADGGLHGAGGTKVVAGDIALGQNVFGMTIYSDSGKHCALPFR